MSVPRSLASTQATGAAGAPPGSATPTGDPLSKVFEDLFNLPGTGLSADHPEPMLILPTLLDLMVNSAPDQVLGDGGSLYLRIPIPEGKAPQTCVGCRRTKDKGGGESCPYRAYEVATTRDYARVEIGLGFYCVNPACCAASC